VVRDADNNDNDANNAGCHSTITRATNRQLEKVTNKVHVDGIKQFAIFLTATGTHMPYGITQCYLPPGRGDIPAFTSTS